MTRVVVCDYAAGNVRSVIGALRRLGCSVDVSSDPAAVQRADLVVLPGVGSAAAAMESLRSRGLDTALRLRVAAGKPVLGICLGMQLACESSAEDDGTPCLGLVPGTVERLRGARVPFLGWADVDVPGGAFYFAHSYAAVSPAQVGRSHGVAAMVRHGAFLGVQFHPEKSGPAGEAFLQRVVDALPALPEFDGGASRPAAHEYPRLIPCLDVADGRVVKCVSFENQRDIGDPVELARHYSRGGADELVFLDITATVRNRSTTLDMVRRVADEVAIPFTVGGGIRSVDDAVATIDAGADRVAINTAAFYDPGLITAIARRFGSQAVVVAIDARDGLVATDAGRRPTATTAVQWARRAEAAGAGEILLTSIDRDGTRSGYAIELTANVAAAVGIPVIASGGAGSAADVATILGVAQAALVASIVHDDPAGLDGVRARIGALGVALRPVAASAPA